MRVAVGRAPAGLDLLRLAADPRWAHPAVVTVRGWRCFAAEPVGTLGTLPALETFAACCAWRSAAARPPDHPPFAAGALGYLSDDLSPSLLGLPADHRPAVASLCPLWFGVYDTLVWQPPGDERAWLVAADLPGWSREPAQQRLRRLASRLRQEPQVQVDVPPCGGQPSLSLDAPAHRRAVRQVLEWIGAGDLYQLNLTLQLARPWEGTAANLARRLAAATPGAAHAALLQVPGGAVVSVSPETFLRVDGDRVVTRPIKGTRPRRVDPNADAAEAADLIRSGKDRAEHVMIVDLERNDLGRVCVDGSIRVEALAALEAHPTVWHLTSTVSGRLRADTTFGELLAAAFPPGSVTGAPKRMAVERTQRVEPVRRGVYCGAIGVVAPGLVELAVAIRTAVVAGGIASYGTGGGIVAESDADAEFAEAMTKAAAFLSATAGP